MLFLPDTFNFVDPALSESGLTVSELDVTGYSQLVLTSAGTVVESLICDEPSKSLVVSNRSSGMVYIRNRAGGTGEVQHQGLNMPLGGTDSPRLAPGQSCLLQKVGSVWAPIIRLPYNGATYAALDAARFTGLGVGNGAKSSATFGGNTARIQWITLDCPATVSRVVTNVVTGGGLYDVELYPLAVSGSGMMFGDAVVSELGLNGSSTGVNSRTLSAPVHLPEGAYASVLTMGATATGLRIWATTQVALAVDSGNGNSTTHWSRTATQGVANQFGGGTQSVTSGAQTSTPPLILWGA